MSRLRFPRVAPRTRRPNPRPAQLPPLRCAIYQNGELIDFNEQPDPRIEFCRAFNEQSAKWGMSAVPVTEGGDA